jgi:hypothetical protein
MGLSVACARTSPTGTTDTSSTSVSFTINLADRPNFTKYRYFVVITPSRAPTLPSPAIGDYLPTPGSTLDLNNTYLINKPNGLTSYYESFFSTWAMYILITQDGLGNPTVKLFSSNAIGFDRTTTQNLSIRESTNFVPLTFAVSGTRIVLRFDKAYIPLVGAQVFYNIATTELLDGTQSGMIRDILDTGVSSPIQLTKGITQDLRLDDDGGYVGVASPANITSWEVKIL